MLAALCCVQPCALLRCASPRLAPPIPPLKLSSVLTNKALFVQGSQHLSAFLDVEVGVPLQGFEEDRLLTSLIRSQKLFLFFFLNE